MAIKKVWIDEGCIACGNCEAVCPEVFYLTDFSNVKEDADFSKYEKEIQEAADDCPAQVIHYE